MCREILSRSKEYIKRVSRDISNKVKLKAFRPNGAELVAGKLIHNGVYGTQWDYNKFAVFNPKQIRIRYACHIELTANDAVTKSAPPQHLPFGKVVSRGIWKFASGKRWTEYDNEISEVSPYCLLSTRVHLNYVGYGRELST